MPSVDAVRRARQSGVGHDVHGECRHELESNGWAATARAADEQQRSSRSHLMGSIAADLERQQQVRLLAARLFEEVRQRRAVGTRASNQQVIDRRGQVAKKLLEGFEIGGVEDGHKGLAVLERRWALLLEVQVGLVHQSGGLQRMVGTSAAQVQVGYTTEFRRLVLEQWFADEARVLPCPGICLNTRISACV